MTPALLVACAAIGSAPQPVALPGDAPRYNTTFTPDGNTLVTTLVLPSGRSQIVSYARRDDAWVESDHFNGALDDRDAGDGAFSPDGSVFLFVEDRDVWITRRVRDDWTDPEPLPPHINTPAFEAYPRLADDGALVLTRDAGANWDVYSAPPEGDAWGQPVRLPAPINTARREHDASPHADALIFVRRDDPLGAGATDIFISRRAQTGWQAPRAAPFNSPHIDGSPCPTPDGRWLYFTSSRPLKGERAQKFRLWRVPMSSLSL